MLQLNYFFVHFRELLDEKLKFVLSEYHRNRRTQISQVNIKTNFIAWLVEFLGCMTIGLDFLVFGNRSDVISDLLETLTLLCFFVLLPSAFLINSSAGINTIVDYSWAEVFTKIYESPDKQIGIKSFSDQSRVSTRPSKVKSTSISIIPGPSSDEKGKCNKKPILATKEKRNTFSLTVPQNRRLRKLAWTDGELEGSG